MPLENQDTLHTIAEIAVALAGFTGIVTVFGSRSAQSAPQDALRLRQLFRSSLSALFCSLAPILISMVNTDSQQVWKLSCAVVAAVMAINLRKFWARITFKDLPRSQKIYFVIGPAIVIALISAALGETLDPRFTVFSGLLWMLWVASQNFLLLLGSYISDDG